MERERCQRTDGEWICREPSPPRWAGVLCLTFAAGIVLAFILGHNLGDAPEELLVSIVVYGFGGLFFLLLGVHLLFGVEELRMDVSGKKYRLRRGLLGAKAREGTFDELHSLALEREVETVSDTDKNNTVWRVYLAWKDPGVRRFLVHEGEDCQRASQTLERVSDELGLPATDRTKSDRVAPSTAEKGPFRQNNDPPGSPGVTLPDRPPSSRLSVDVGERSVHIVLRPRRLAWRGLLATAVFLGVLVCILPRREFSGVAMFAGLGLIAYVLTTFLAAHHVIADRRQLTVYKRFAGFDWKRRTLGMCDVQQVYLEASRPYDLALGKLSRIVILTSAAKIEFAADGGEKDKVWVVETLKEIARAAIGTPGASRNEHR